MDKSTFSDWLGPLGKMDNPRPIDWLNLALSLAALKKPRLHGFICKFTSLVFMFYDSLNRSGTATEVDHISIKLKVWVMNTSMNKPVFIITRIIHQATSYKLLDKVLERYKPVSFIKPGFVIGSMKIFIKKF